MTLKVFIGYDSREQDAYDVAAFSIERRSSLDLDISPLRLNDLTSAGLYHRSVDPLASTEFTYTRFLTPFLAGYRQKALFFDCDFLWLGDVAELLSEATGSCAVWCVKHDYRPKDNVKMDGVVQTSYPRKNWSSLMLFDCEHISTKRLTVDVVNKETPAFLHRMNWAEDGEIGELSTTWNWLEGWNEKPAAGTPKAIHFTRGGPWFESWRDVDYADLWLAELEAFRSSQ
jgi:lipopolysaccharide biosynthesis glycosyltransferase